MEKHGKLSVALVLVASLSLLLVASAFAGECEQAAKSRSEHALKSTEFFEVAAPNEVDFREGVEYETVKNAEGREVIRYGYNLGDPSNALVVGAIECRCGFPTVCTDDTCESSTTGGNAKCRGGCYRPDGTSCVSCEFYDAQPLPE